MDGLLRGPFAYEGTHHRVDADLLPRPVQQPRPPLWVAGVAPHRRPLQRALRYDGVVPIGDGRLLDPTEVDAYLDGIDRPPGWDVVVNTAPGIPVEDYAAVGATWVVDGAWPEGEWVADLRDRINAGPGM